MELKVEPKKTNFKVKNHFVEITNHVSRLLDSDTEIWNPGVLDSEVLSVQLWFDGVGVGKRVLESLSQLNIVNSSFPEEAEAVVETKMDNKPTSSELQKIQEKQKLIKEPGSGVPVVLITTLLVIPVVVLLAIAIFIRWKKSRAFGGK